MKKITKLLVVFTAVVFFAGCDNFLDQPPIGGTLIQEQYDALGNKLEGSMRGVYSTPYPITMYSVSAPSTCTATCCAVIWP